MNLLASTYKKVMIFFQDRNINNNEIIFSDNFITKKKNKFINKKRKNKNENKNILNRLNSKITKARDNKLNAQFYNYFKKIKETTIQKKNVEERKEKLIEKILEISQ